MTNLLPNPLVREMLKRILENLWNLKGSRQYIDIAAATPDNPKELAEKKLDALLMPMIRVCNTFDYISLEEKEKIIEEAIIRDPEFYGLNAGKIWQYLNWVSGKYFKQEAHTKTEEESRASNAKVVDSEQADRYFKLWIEKLKKVESRKIPPLTREQIETEGKEKITPKATAGHVPEETEEHASRRSEAIRKLGYHKLSPQEVAAMKIFKVGGHDIRARNQEEAEQIALEVYA